MNFDPKAKNLTPFNSPSKVISTINGNLPKNRRYSGGHSNSDKSARGAITPQIVAVVSAEKLFPVDRHDDSISQRHASYPVNIQNVNPTGFRKIDDLGKESGEILAAHDNGVATVHDDVVPPNESTTAKAAANLSSFSESSNNCSRRLSGRFKRAVPLAFTTPATASVTTATTALRKITSVYDLESVLANGNSDEFLKYLVQISSMCKIDEIPMCNKEAVLNEYFLGVKQNLHDVVKQCLKRFTHYSMDYLWETGTKHFDMFTMAVILEAKVRNSKLPTKPCHDHKISISAEEEVCCNCGKVRMVTCVTCGGRWCVDASCMASYKEHGEEVCFLVKHCVSCGLPRHDDVVTETPAGYCLCSVEPKIDFMDHTM